MRIRLSLAVLAAAGLGLGGASAALAGPLDDAAGPGPGAGVRLIVSDSVGYALDLVGIGDLPNVDVVEVRIPLVAIVNEAYEPVANPVRETHGGVGYAILDTTELVDFRMAELVDVSSDRVGALEEFVNGQCGECFPTLGGPIGPVPVGPVGDEARYQVNRGITTVNQTYADYGNGINAICGTCFPGLGGPIGPVPVGPVGDENPYA